MGGSRKFCQRGSKFDSFLIFILVDGGLQYCRPQTYSDALKYSFFPRTIPHWNSLAPSVVAAETTEEFRALIWMTQLEAFFFCPKF